MKFGLYFRIRLEQPLIVRRMALGVHGVFEEGGFGSDLL